MCTSSVEIWITAPWSYSLVTGKENSQKSLLLTCQILGLLVNTLATDEKYLVLNRDNLTITIQTELSKKQKKFSQFCAAFLKNTLSFEYFEKKLTLTASAFLKLVTLKTWLDKCLKRLVSENTSTSDMLIVAKHCWILRHSTFFIFIDWSPGNWAGKSLFFLTWKILELLVKTLAANKMYLVLHSDNLTIPIHMQLSQKQKTFSEFFVAFLKSRLTSEHV